MTLRLEQYVHPAANLTGNSLQSLEGPLRLAPLVSLAALATLAACASSPPRQYGQYSALQPRFSMIGKEGTRPEQLSVALTQPAYVAVLYVVPGRGATIIYPVDSTSPNHVEAGTQTITVNFPKPPQRDTMALRRRLEQQRGQRGGRGGQRQGTPAQRDTTPRFLADTSLAASPGGYLLMIASPTAMSYSAIKHRTDGITIPMEDDEALNTVVKLVRSAMPEDAAWAAVSKEINIDEQYAPPPQRRPGR